MVRDMVVRDWPRESFPRHTHHPYLTERFPSDGLDDGRFPEPQDVHRRQPPMQIDEALRQHCAISSRRYFLAVIMDDGSPMTFSGPGTSRLDDEVMRQFFDEDKYRRVMDRLDTGASPVVDDGFSFDGYKQPFDYQRNRIAERRRASGLEDWDAGPARQGRKRPRARHLVNEEEDMPMTVSTTMKGIKIGNADDVWTFYEQRFKNCQQTACKLIAKAWVKAVEPKKQSTHPYTGKDEKAPDWWPKPWGPTKEDKVRHKEPDHLYKRERVHLLNHILRMIVEPSKTQHADIQKLNLNVKKLEEITVEALSGFFADKDNPANSRKRPYLNEIFKVAKQEERFRNGEIDGTTEVYVKTEDKMPETYGSGNDDDGPIPKDEEDQDISSSKLANIQGLMPPSTDHNAGASLHGTPFLSELPVRNTQYAPSMMQEIGPDQHAFVEGSNMPVNSQSSVHSAGNNIPIDIGVSPAHDNSRRPSIFNSPAEYGGQNGTNLYTPQWQTASAAPNTSAIYTFTQQQPNASAAAFVNPGVAMNQNQSYMGAPFDGISRGYDPNQPAMFRQGGVPQPQVHAAQSYNYVAHDNRGFSGIKVDPASRGAMH